LALGATLCLAKDRYDLFGCESFPGHLFLLSGPETNSRTGSKSRGNVIIGTAFLSSDDAAGTDSTCHLKPV
ncbi:MAG: hypothetical protein JSW58_05445, partial [Candidatus Latescibacterota bacterium]